LEFRSVLLLDIKQEISGFDESESVWSVMEKLKVDGDRSAEFERLMSAFYQYRQQQSHE